MKKILLATTVLAMSAGFAAAEVKLSGSASMGVARQGGTDGTAAVAAVAGVLSEDNVTAANILIGGNSALEAGDTFTEADLNALVAAVVNKNATVAAMLVLLEATSEQEDLDDAAAALAVANASHNAVAIAAAQDDYDAALSALQGTDEYDDWISAGNAALAALAVLQEAAGTAEIPAVASIAAGDFQVYNSGELDIAATVVSDAGVEFGVSTSVSFGNSYTFGDGDTFATEDGTIGAPTLTAKGAFGTLTFADDGIDQLYSDATAGDFSYAYSAGDLSFTLVSDVNGSTDVEWSANVAYSMSGVSMSLTSDSNDSYAASVSYTSGGITGTIDTDSEAGADAVNTLTVAYAANGMTFEVSGDSTDYSSIAVGYSANGLGVNVSTDTDDAWEATTSYDLGGGASFVAGVNYTEDAYAGIDLTF